MKSRLNSFGLPIIIAIFIFYGLSQFWAAFIGIQYHFGTGWALGALALAIFARFTLPITIGAFFGAMDVWGWSWLISFIFAAPGLAYMAITLPAVVFEKSISVSNYFKKKQNEDLDVNNSTNEQNRNINKYFVILLVIMLLVTALFSFISDYKIEAKLIKKSPKENTDFNSAKLDAQKKTFPESKGASSVSNGGGVTASEFRWYHELIHERFFSQWEQPTSIFDQDKSFVCTVKIHINRDGTIKSSEIIKSSANPAMDQSVQAALGCVSKIDPLPTGLGSVDGYAVNINFELQ